MTYVGVRATVEVRPSWALELAVFIGGRNMEGVFRREKREITWNVRRPFAG